MTAKGIVLSLVSGVLMGSVFPVVEMGKSSELGLGPDAIGFVFSVGVFLSTFVFNLFFMNFPVQGEPVGIWQYFKGTPRQHLLGIAGGVIWSTGAIANFAGGSGHQLCHRTGRHHGERALGTAGMERVRRCAKQTKLLVVVMLILFVCGLALVSIAPLYARS